mmetsp:Transcript_19476/g.29574  ORF Transcript_19476/g.29574 Transcript_19476/m.29574 type:complete len:182 (-) Transcript_19476:198-743(-)|eukprot:CAMPEP_0118702568 /NCGR_PEP_ID=MMETSP0800-20121206/17968_1 /TAXON_ID=210618 ORGANISM="Striatella unipunctata, Strain CCMP2910" /NCGR_SAMPLE_ID=MMETSP0800 /ASSEMBLY_ACC=CAM_ASM_000638 /LENGTH=181 /DNA_ID=CAMNT_0006603793 /DNA_START=143 /DNA_END=688 /DNA_ORIENTATION=+
MEHKGIPANADDGELLGHRISDDKDDDSLEEDELANEPASKRPRTEEQKRMERILANRRSARESRERKKRLQSKLEESVAALTRENAELLKQNEALRGQLNMMKELHSQNRQVVHPPARTPPAGNNHLLGGLQPPSSSDIDLLLSYGSGAGANHIQQLRLMQQLSSLRNPLAEDVIKASLR